MVWRSLSVGGAHPTWLEKKVKIGMVSPDSGFRIRILPGFRAPSLGGFPQEESSFIYRRNGRVFSSLTGRAGGLLNSLVNRGHAAIAIIGCSFCLGGVLGTWV